MLSPDQIDDLVNLTLKYFKRNTWVDLSLANRNTSAQRLSTRKNLVEFSGPKINWKVVTGNMRNARNTGLYSIDQTKVDDVTN